MILIVYVLLKEELAYCILDGVGEWSSTCVLSLVWPCTLGRGRRAKKHTVVCGIPGFLGVVDARVCNRYQALFSPPSGPGYEASVHCHDKFGPPPFFCSSWSIYFEILGPPALIFIWTPMHVINYSRNSEVSGAGFRVYNVNH